MQHFKSLYNDLECQKTFSNIQQCLRLNDWQEVGDGTHYLSFEMIGLFSFREWSLQQSIDFMWSFLQKLNIKPDYVTIHPDKYEDWKHLYEKYNIEIKTDLECLWSDGSIGGYCTEFYKNNIEIGNIVNTLGTCIDIGFGLERLLQVSNSLKSKTRLEILEDTSLILIDSGINIGHYKEEFILKKIIIECVISGSLITHEYYNTVRKNQVYNYRRYLRNKDRRKFSDKGDEFWLNTFGVDINKIHIYEKMLEIESGES